jgi:Zn-dependent protease with chaperone function
MLIRRSWCAALALVLGGLAGGLRASAAEMPARLTLTVRPSGAVQADLALPASAADPAGARGAMRGLFRVPVGELREWKYEDTWVLSGTSPTALRRDGLRFRGDVDLQPLLHLVAAGGGDQLIVTALLPAGLRRGSTMPSGARDRSVQAEAVWFTLPVGASGSWRWEFGYRPADAALQTVPLALLCTGAVVLLLALRRAVLCSRGKDAARVWLGYRRWAQWVLGGFLLAWVIAFATTGGESLIQVAAASVPPALRRVLVALGYLAPPGLLGILQAGFAHEPGVRARGIEWALGESVAQSALQIATLVVPLSLLIAAVPSSGTELRATILLLVAAIASALALGALHRRSTQGPPHEVTSGALRDRIVLLARRAGVRFGQLHLVPASRSRLAHGFAVNGATMLITDQLLRHLNRRELDAVVGHELAHLKLRHPLWLAALVAVASTGGVLAFPQGLGPFGPVPGLAALGIVILAGLLAVHRWFERQADREALRLGAEPDALITALVRLGRLHHVPLEGSPWDAESIAYPSTLQRARAIAKWGDLSSHQLAELLRSDDPPADPYPTPLVATPPVSAEPSTPAALRRAS